MCQCQGTVIPGWEEVLPTMRSAERALVDVPSALACVIRGGREGGREGGISYSSVNPYLAHRYNTSEDIVAGGGWLGPGFKPTAGPGFVSVYGPSPSDGAGPWNVPHDKTLRFEIELIAIVRRATVRDIAGASNPSESGDDVAPPHAVAAATQSGYGTLSAEGAATPEDPEGQGEVTGQPAALTDADLAADRAPNELVSSPAVAEVQEPANLA